MNNSKLSERFEKASLFIKAAGQILLQYYGKNKEVQHKSQMDLVTKADKESEKYLFTSLTNAFPEDSVIGEEGAGYKGKNGYTWILDPLDGTTSFVHNFPMFVVSVGLLDPQNTPVLGLVYNPFYDELFHAQKGEGAFLGQVRASVQRLSVSKTDKLEESLVGTGFPYYRKNCIPRLFEKLEKVLLNTHGMRRTGSAALDICFLAAGRYDAYYEEGLKSWDAAAAILIASEAGAIYSKFDGSDFDLFFGEILVANKTLHRQFVELFRQKS